MDSCSFSFFENIQIKISPQFLVVKLSRNNLICKDEDLKTKKPKKSHNTDLFTFHSAQISATTTLLSRFVRNKFYFFLETFQFHWPLEQTNGTEIISSMTNLSPYFLNLNLSTWQALGANQRNYAEIQITIEPEFSVIAQLKVTSSSTIFQITHCL